jgi:hypothetical protein
MYFIFLEKKPLSSKVNGRLFIHSVNDQAFLKKEKSSISPSNYCRSSNFNPQLQKVKNRQRGLFNYQNQATLALWMVSMVVLHF